MQTKQAKTQNPKPATESAELTKKVAYSAGAFTHLPAWTHAWGDQPPTSLQAKLTVNQPGDPYEQEADRIADQVMRMPDSSVSVQRKCACGGTPGPSGECKECANKRLALQRRSTSHAESSTAPPVVHEVLSGGGGRPLDTATRTFMEPRFGHDFGQVHVHTDARAVESARAVNALAYTVGRDVVFGAGQYAPESSKGQQLLAHELTHVVQQNREPAASANAFVPLSARVITNGLASTVKRDTSQTLHRTVDIPVATSHFDITAEPLASLKVVNLLNKWRARPQTPGKIEFTARADVTCGSGDSAAGYEIGIIQIQTREVNNALYQGVTSADGSVRVRLDSPTVRPPGPCHDSHWGSISPGKSGPLFWNEFAPAVCGRPIQLTYSDWPGDMYDTIIDNPITHKPNYLRELHVAFEFTTALMLRRPDNSLQTLRWARWNVSWDYTFATPANGQSTVQRGIAMTGTVTFTDPPPSPPELPTSYALPGKNCNTLTSEANANPARIQASNTW